MRFRFGEIAAGPTGPAVALRAWGDDHNTLVLGLVLCTLYLRVPRWLIKGQSWEMGYGFAFCDTGLHVHWGEWAKVLWYPWSWDFYKRWELVEGESYATGQHFWIEVPRLMANGQIATKHSAPYVYQRRNGDRQEVVATFYVSFMEWRWRWFSWLPWPRKTEKAISVEFSAEVGEGTGSWKGGVLGCGYSMRENESPIQCLRRMERECKFDR